MQVSQYVEARIAAYPHLTARRAALHCNLEDITWRDGKQQTRSLRSELHAGVRCRLWWAALQWLAHAEASRATPPGLEDAVALCDGLYATYMPPGAKRTEVVATVDGRAALAMLDGMLCDYDAQRAALWPASDAALEHLLFRAHAAGGGSAAVDGTEGVRNAATAQHVRERSKALLAYHSHVLGFLVPRQVLAMLGDQGRGWLVGWRLDVRAPEVRLQPRWPAA